MTTYPANGIKELLKKAEWPEDAQFEHHGAGFRVGGMTFHPVACDASYKGDSVARAGFIVAACNYWLVHLRGLPKAQEERREELKRANQLITDHIRKGDLEAEASRLRAENHRLRYGK